GLARRGLLDLRSERGSLLIEQRGRAARLLDQEGDLVDLPVPRNPGVVTELVADELTDQDRRSEGHRQAEDGDRAIELVSRQVAQGRDQIVAEHGGVPLPRLAA